MVVVSFFQTSDKDWVPSFPSNGRIKKGTDPNAGQLSLLAVTVAMECFLVFMAGFVHN